jgi:thiamine biosynthesis lipoprotein
MLPLLVAILLGTPPAVPAVPQPVRATSTAFGVVVEVEARDLSEAAARAALEKALAEVAEVERLTDLVRADGGLTALNAASGQGPRPVDPRLLSVLTRSRNFCLWSEGAHGPLGRDLYSLWGLRSPVVEPPAPDRLAQAVDVATCDRLSLDPKGGTVTLAAGSSLELWGFAEGFAVDQAAELLRREGVVNGFVRIGGSYRGFGAGPAGKGWPVVLDPLPGVEESATRVFLRDRSLAIAMGTARPLQVAGETLAPYVNQRTGRLAGGVLAVATFTELAVDAHALAATLLITGPREGQLRLGSLKPQPSVLWFMGAGSGLPVRVEYHWSLVPKR